MDDDKARSDIAKLLGKRGGLKTKEKYGTEYYKQLMSKAAKARWAKHRQKKEAENKAAK